MEIKLINTDEIDHFKSLIEIFKAVFENDKPFPRDEYLSKLLSNSDFLVLVALQNSEIIGGLTVFILHTYYSEKPVAYIYDVAVKPNFQGKGVGKSLMGFLTDHCKRNGFQEAYVEAETDDSEAVSFYRKTNFSNELHATHFTYSFDNIEGIDQSKNR